MELTTQIPSCPLCDKRMSVIKTPLGTFYYCVRQGCMVSCRADDPLIEQWNDPQSQIHCHLCGKPMKTFIRQDEYAKAICKCGFKLESIPEE
jgi:hypothetical protein